MSDIIMQIQDIVKEFPLADGSTLRACNGISIDGTLNSFSIRCRRY